jgi:hypothetical protein
VAQKFDNFGGHDCVRFRISLDKFFGAVEKSLQYLRAARAKLGRLGTSEL